MCLGESVTPPEKCSILFHKSRDELADYKRMRSTMGESARILWLDGKKNKIVLSWIRRVLASQLSAAVLELVRVRRVASFKKK
jgi:hypothetical protein